MTFTYPGAARAAILDLDLDVPAGTLIAVTGPVGAGKSAHRLAALADHQNLRFNALGPYRNRTSVGLLD